jgi:hypothetical protein
MIHLQIADLALQLTLGADELAAFLRVAVAVATHLKVLLAKRVTFGVELLGFGNVIKQLRCFREERVQGRFLEDRLGLDGIGKDAVE